MVMLGRALALDRDIPNSRIIIVTDRDDLDKQIKGTFKSCDMEPVRATSGSHLVELLRNTTPLVTTIINKFDTAMWGGDLRDRKSAGAGRSVSVGVDLGGARTIKKKTQ